MVETSETSHVLAADYRVLKPDSWWPQVRGNREALGRLGARHMVVYQAIDDPTRVFTTIGIHHRGPLDALLRSGVVLEWFDAAGVENIPPLFAGTVVEKVEIAASNSAGEDPPGVVVAAIAPVEDIDSLLIRIHRDMERFRAAGVRKVWVYRALDDAQEAMILQEIDTLAHAQRWLRHGAELDEWMSGAGVGVYPPVFVGTLLEAVESHPWSAKD